MITNEDFKKLIDKHYENFTEDDDCYDVLEKAYDDLAAKLGNNTKFSLEYTHSDETQKQVLELVFQLLQANDGKIKDYVIYYCDKVGLTFFAVEYK